MKIISIDPGSTESAYVVWDGKVIDMAEKVSNQRMLAIINSDESEYMVIEKITSYGMAVGETTFDTVYWTGRFCEAWSFRFGDAFLRMPRHEVKMHLCHSTRAKDANIIQAEIKTTMDKKGISHFTIEVEDYKQLQDIMGAIKKVRHVLMVERV